MGSSNVPKHGESIIDQQQSALGASKLVANKQFQRFLDELGTLFDQAAISNADIIQLLAGDSATFESRLSFLRSMVIDLGNASQEIYANKTTIDKLTSENRRLNKIIEENSQSLAGVDSALANILQSGRAMNRRIDELEQLLNEH